MKKTELNSLDFEESKEFMLGINEKNFRGEQLFSYFNKNKGIDLEKLTTFSKELRSKISGEGYVNEIKILKRFNSSIDETKKYLFLLRDNNIIEGVLMKYPHGYSLCISTQIGCRMGCSFCASGKAGLVRSLNTAEILNQVYMVEKDQAINISNLVLMGSGEPLDNYDNVLKFLKIINHEKGKNLSYRNITLSTSGLVPMIDKLADENIPITLSISLHSPFDEYRSDIMPVARKYKLRELIDSCRNYERKTKRRITFEYTLIEGVNDRQEDVVELAKILGGLNCHINIIPLNPIEEYNEERPTDRNVYLFKEKLSKKGLNATIRTEKGSDIDASCGQLRRDYLEGNI